MYHIRLQVLAALFAALLLTSCSGGSKPTLASTKSEVPAASEQTASEPVSGKTAFWQMYKSAYAWSADLVPLSLESKTVPGMKNEAGKAAMWSATFGSPKRREARRFTYAVAAHGPDVIKGVTVGRALPWGGPSQNALPFDTSDLSLDSDAVYKAALADAAAWTKKHPGKDVSFTLGNASRFAAPVWYVLWGDKKSGYAVMVNARTGAVIKRSPGSPTSP